jgi:hypothetical protein
LSDAAIKQLKQILVGGRGIWGNYKHLQNKAKQSKAGETSWGFSNNGCPFFNTLNGLNSWVVLKFSSSC